MAELQKILHVSMEREPTGEMFLPGTHTCCNCKKNQESTVLSLNTSKIHPFIFLLLLQYFNIKKWTFGAIHVDSV